MSIVDRNVPLKLALIASLSVSALCFAPRDVSAQQDAQLDEETTKKLLEMIGQAKALEKEGKHKDALELYKQAYDLSPQGALLYRMGRACERSGDMQCAIEYYDKFVAALPDNPKAVEVKSKVAELRASIPPRLKIVTEPSGANIYLDSAANAPIGSTPFDGEFQKGKVTILVKLDGYETYQQEYDFSGAEVEELKVSLKKLEESSGPTDVSKNEPKKKGSGKGLKLAGYVSTGLGVALLGGGGAFTVLSNQKVNEYNNYDRAGAASPQAGRIELAQLKEDADAHWRRSMIMYSAGGVLTAAGVAMIVLGSGGQEEAAEPTALRLDMGMTPGGAFMGVFKRF